MTWTMLNAMDAHAIQGFDFERCGGAMHNGGQLVQLVWPTADGHIVAVPNSRVFIGCTEWMIADGVADESLRDVDWVEYDFNVRNPDYEPFSLKRGMALLGEFLALHTNAELYQFGLEKRVSLAPSNTIPELLALEHLKERDFWQAAESDLARQAGVECMPGHWAKPRDGSMRARPAPKLSQHTDKIVRDLIDMPAVGDMFQASDNSQELP